MSTPFHEPLRNTLKRNLTIALIAGTVFAAFRGGWSGWPAAVLLMLWPSFGGHWVEVLYLNGLRPRLPDNRVVQSAGRVITWFLGGALLSIGMGLSATVLTRLAPSRWPAWWLGGLAFIAIELVVHTALYLSGRPSLFKPTI